MISVNIPAERISVLLGQNGEVKKMIAKRGRVKIHTEEDGVVELSGASIDEWVAKDIVTAIGRGFSPQKAIKLFSDLYSLRVINLREFGSDNDIIRICGRLIGEKGKTRRIIEEMTGCEMSVYTHTVSLIGELEGLHLATEAVYKIIEGSPHAVVYTFLERGRRRMKIGNLVALKESSLSEPERE
ncbi:KH domain protein [Candidatus Gugararchaeum adminiculabundum]|nr:KH domain protein [Candidatus Gugararchaeum adminiculabundum]